MVDCRILQRLDYPEYVIDVDRAKAADLGLTQEEVMKSVIGALNSSIQYNKLNFWIDDVSGNPYFVGVQYPPVERRVDPDAARRANHGHQPEQARPPC